MSSVCNCCTARITRRANIIAFLEDLDGYQIELIGEKYQRDVLLFIHTFAGNKPLRCRNAVNGNRDQ